MLICFLFKTDIQIGLFAVPIFDKQNEPLYHIPEEKGKVEQLLLLRCMYPFVIILNRIQRPDRKDKPKQTYCQIGSPHRMPLNQKYPLPFNHK